MMSIGRSSRRENLLRVTECRAHARDQDPLVNHIRASSVTKNGRTNKPGT